MLPRTWLLCHKPNPHPNYLVMVFSSSIQINRHFEVIVFSQTRCVKIFYRWETKLSECTICKSNRQRALPASSSLKHLSNTSSETALVERLPVRVLWKNSDAKNLLQKLCSDNLSGTFASYALLT
jgi:hypothetical protein